MQLLFRLVLANERLNHSVVDNIDKKKKQVFVIGCYCWPLGKCFQFGFAFFMELGGESSFILSVLSLS